MKHEEKKRNLPQRIFRKIGKKQKHAESSRNKQISQLCSQAMQYITILKMAEIPMEYWSPDAMNWVLIRWGQKQSMDFHILFARYDSYIEETKTGTEKLRLKSQEPPVPQQFKKTALLRFRGVEGSPEGGLHSPPLHLCKFLQNFPYTTDPQYLLLSVP